VIYEYNVYKKKRRTRAKFELIGLFFYPEVGCSRFLQNTGKCVYLPGYTALHHSYCHETLNPIATNLSTW
jgi:hypothetical protein